MKKILLISVAAITLVISLWFYKFAFAFSVSFQQEETSVDGVTVISNLWIRDRNVRVETVLFNQVAVTIFKDSDIYMYIKGQKTATKTNQMGSDFGRDSLGEYQKFLKEQNAILIGEEAVDGMSCSIYTYKDLRSGSLVKIWVWKEKEFPIKYEISSQNGTEKIKVKNIQLDISLSDELFKLPPDVSVTEVKRPQ